jgi:hypothetical protein
MQASNTFHTRCDRHLRNLLLLTCPPKNMAIEQIDS